MMRLGVCALVLVALPAYVESTGVSASEWGAQVRSATFFGLLNSFLLFDSVKVLALFLTGPHILLRLPEGRMRAIVRAGSKGAHKPLAALMP